MPAREEGERRKGGAGMSDARTEGNSISLFVPVTRKGGRILIPCSARSSNDVTLVVKEQIGEKGSRLTAPKNKKADRRSGVNASWKDAI